MNYRLIIVPPAVNAAAIALDQLAERDSHRLFDVARTLDVTGNAEQLCADVIRLADAGEPCCAPPQYIGRDRDGFNIVDGRWAAVETDIGGEWRFQPRHTLFAFEAFQQRRLFAADVGASSMGDVKVERPAVHIILADQFGL